jgi:hypothetical protein
MSHDKGMLEVQLRSGQVVAFDGRVLEVFADGMASRRFHLAQLSRLEAVEAADGAHDVVLEEGAVTLAFAPEEKPACARLLAAVADAQAQLARNGSR